MYAIFPKYSYAKRKKYTSVIKSNAWDAAAHPQSTHKHPPNLVGWKYLFSILTLYLQHCCALGGQSIPQSAPTRHKSHSDRKMNRRCKQSMVCHGNSRQFEQSLKAHTTHKSTNEQIHNNNNCDGIYGKWVKQFIKSLVSKIEMLNWTHLTNLNFKWLFKYFGYFGGIWKLCTRKAHLLTYIFLKVKNMRNVLNFLITYFFRFSISTYNIY